MCYGIEFYKEKKVLYFLRLKYPSFLKCPSQFFFCCTTWSHVSCNHEFLNKTFFFFFKGMIYALKSMHPFPSLSKSLKICSTITRALPSGIIIEYIWWTFALSSFPLGQSCRNPLQVICMKKTLSLISIYILIFIIVRECTLSSTFSQNLLKFMKTFLVWCSSFQQRSTTNIERS